LGASSVHMRNYLEINLRWHMNRECHAESPKQNSLCVWHGSILHEPPSL
jgi:hypothetical protein